MPDAVFLEKFTLYRKYEIEVPEYVYQLSTPSIHMYCDVCGSEQTFNLSNSYGAMTEQGLIEAQIEHQNMTDLVVPTRGAIVHAIYTCAGCRQFDRHFLISISEDRSYVMKVGQYPRWLPATDKKIEKSLGDHIENYKKGLNCEQEGFGIGAFAYYRRIIEDMIDELLDSLSELLDGETKESYGEALKEAKKEHIAENKIKIVKDLIPDSLRPNNINPLNILYSNLSMGLHSIPEEECLEMAVLVRKALIFLIDQVMSHKEEAREFTRAIRELEERKAKKRIRP